MDKLTAPGKRTRMFHFPAIWTFFQKKFHSFQFNFHCKPQSIKTSKGCLRSAICIPGMECAY